MWEFILLLAVAVAAMGMYTGWVDTRESKGLGCFDDEHSAELFVAHAGALAFVGAACAFVYLLA